MRACIQATCVLLLPFLLSAQSTLHRVPSAFSTIQQAIDASNAGDTVLIDHGVFVENIVLNKNILLGSRFLLDGDVSHTSRTIIDGSGPKDPSRASVVTVVGPTDTTCMIRGLTIRGGGGTSVRFTGDRAYEAMTWVAGGGILVLGTGVQISDNIITDNSISAPGRAGIAYGAGIASIDTTIGRPDPPYHIVERNIVTWNTGSGVSARGGGMDIGQPGLVRNNVITDNKVLGKIRTAGGGALLQHSAKYEILFDGNYVTRNSASVGGGIHLNAPYARSGTSILTNNVITHNTAAEMGGGVFLYPASTAILAYNTIVGNRSGSPGAGVTVPEPAELNLVNNIFWNNTVADGSPYQVRSSTPLRAWHNVLQNQHFGRNTITAPPGFIDGDSLYRISPGSICLGTASDAFPLSDIAFDLPDHDFSGDPRDPDCRTIGAHAPTADRSEVAQNVLNQWEANTRNNISLSVIVTQTTPATYSDDGGFLLRSGRMSTNVSIDHTAPHAYAGPSRDLTFTLEPDQNLIEVDMTILGQDGKTRLGGMLWMEGVDQRFNRTVAGQGHLYMNYQNLRPGDYQLIIRPEDEQEFIDVANQSAMQITVLPYWYNRWWAYASYGLVVAALFFVFYRIRMKGVRLEQTLVTERLQAEKLAELDAMRSRFFANVTHELRTPLTLILGPVGTLLKKTQSVGMQEQLYFIQRNAQKLLRSVQLLLDLSRLESGSVQLRVVRQDAVKILRRIAGYFSSAASGGQKTISFHAPGHEIIGLFDAEKLEHILQNLISNALKFCSAGDRIDVRVWQEPGSMIFSVEDTGPGIAPEHLPHIFDRFYRIDETHKVEGTGIGLSLTKELTEIHRGTIDVQSTPGKGTIMTVRLPLDGYAAEEMAEGQPESFSGEQEPGHIVRNDEPIRADASPHHDGKPIVLIAEDNDDARQFIRSQLSDDYHVLEAVDGQEAINTTQHQIPDLIISDVMMPNKDGREVCAEIKQDERTSHIPVILLTALAEQDQKLNGLSLGADDYLAKPFDAEELKIRARNLIENRIKMREAFMRTTELRPGSIHATSLDDQFLKKALAVVEQNMSSPEFDVSRFAREMFLSSRQLNRKLSAITNFSASEFIRHVRLQRAKDLLEQRSGSVAEIAESVGFSNHSYFAKVFSEKFGSLPGSHLKNT